MKIKTKYHGEITIEEKDIIQFKQGIPGFLDEKQFVMTPLDETGLYHILQSVHTAGIAFIITNPFHFFNTYEFDLDDVTMEKLEIESEQDIAIYSILTVQDVFEQSTINLQAPIVMNHRKRLGKQVILTNTSYQTKHKFINQHVEANKG